MLGIRVAFNHEKASWIADGTADWLWPAAADAGVPIMIFAPDAPDQIGRIDLVVAGSVAVNRTGARLGKGGGYSDLEFALAAERGAVDAQTLVVTTVHDAQVVRGGIPMTAHDVPVDVVATPTRIIRTRRTRPRPAGIDWEELSAAQLAAMPPLAALGRASPRR